jgi:hypothetical protein
VALEELAELADLSVPPLAAAEMISTSSEQAAVERPIPKSNARGMRAMVTAWS